MFKWLLLLASASVAVASAASSPTIGSCAETSYFIQSQLDADSISSCSNNTLTTVTVQSSTLTSLNLFGCQRITNLQISSCPSLVNFSAPDLLWTKNLTVSNLPLLANLSLPSLETVLLSLDWNNLPNLRESNLKTHGLDENGNPGTNIYQDLSIISSGIQQLNNLNFGDTGKIGNIRLVDNPQLELVRFAGLNSSTLLQVFDNNPSIVLHLEDVTRGGAFNIQNIANIVIPNLATLDGDLIVVGNWFENITAPALTAIGGNMLVANNPSLDNIMLPVLTGIGGGLANGSFTITNNTALTTIELQTLNAVDGNTSLTGKFTKQVTYLLENLLDIILTSLKHHNPESHRFIPRILHQQHLPKFQLHTMGQNIPIFLSKQRIIFMLCRHSRFNHRHRHPPRPILQRRLGLHAEILTRRPCHRVHRLGTFAHSVGA
ncbi:hypothetical protein G7Y89_g4282 [Cudoniella acicularis]|uniref:Receptor L-domain domain-containing protein n=1 Tax=Cudoniella acicularis TaxID=354080 RepID=A0A8H4RRX7_9HELO|nr:hypothetical protein G7Y89_g4282 [Cudoniella acicularis]